MLNLTKFHLLFTLLTLFNPKLMAMELMNEMPLVPLNQRLVSVYCSDGILSDINLNNLDKITNIFPYILDPNTSLIEKQPLVKIPDLFFKSKREVYNLIINLSNKNNKKHETKRENKFLTPAMNEQGSVKRPRAIDDPQYFHPVKKARVEYHYEKETNPPSFEGAIVGEFCRKWLEITEDDYNFGLDIRQRTKFSCPIKGCVQEVNDKRTLNKHVQLDHIKCLKCRFAGPQRKFTSHLMNEHALIPCSLCIEEEKKIIAFETRQDLQDHKNNFHLHYCPKKGCAYSTPYKGNLNQHKDSVHYRCTIAACGFSGAEDAYNNHMRLHYGKY